MNDNSVSSAIDTISSNDEMFQNNLDHYFSVGRSALENILAAMRLAGCTTFHSILDLPCGHGRVLRHIRARFPDAALTACDINRDGVDFCAHTFSATPDIFHDRTFEAVNLKSRFDLIWCGSLLTHFDESQMFSFISIPFRASPARRSSYLYDAWPLLRPFAP